MGDKEVGGWHQPEALEVALVMSPAAAPQRHESSRS